MQKIRQLTRTFLEWWFERSVLTRDVLVLGLVVVVFGGGGWVVWKLSRQPYREWQKSRAVSEARERIQTGDHRGALLAFRRATQLSPGDVETWREVAEYLADIGSGEVLVAQRNLVRLAPEDTALRVALVAESLRQGDTLEAREQLLALERHARENIDYHRMAAALALVLGRKGDLETHLEAIAAAAPGDLAARHNLAALRLWGTDPAVSEAARGNLLALLAEPEWRIRSALELLKFAAASGSTVEADRVVGELLRALDPARAEAGLARAEPGEPPGWNVLLEALRRTSMERPNDAALFATWWAGLGQAVAAEAWLAGLPAPLAKDPAVVSVRAGLLANSRRPERLQALLAAGAWGPVRHEVLTLALAARLQALAGARNRADGTWADAVAAAGRSASDLRILARLAAVWREASWSAPALWPLAEHHPRERWALDALRVLLAGKRDSEALWLLYSLWAPRAPDDTAVQSTWLMLAALLDRLGPSTEAAAERLRGRADTGAALAVAAADWRRGRGEAAGAALAVLEDEVSDQAKIAFWRGLVALQRGDETEAGRLLEGLDSLNWLDVETRLLSGARATLRASEAKREAEAAAQALLAPEAEADAVAP